MMNDTLVLKDRRLADIRFQDGALPHAMGVHSFQVLRANRAHPGEADGFGWTYNHAPMLAYYHGRLYIEYLSSPVSEHESPGQVLLTSSEDGMDWSLPLVIFPSVDVPTAQYMGPRSDALKPVMQTVPHHRMGFYRAHNDVMLVLTFYGIVHDRHKSMPCDGWGVGRAVRRLFPDGTLGGIHFLLYNAPGGYTAENTPVFSPYQRSGDRDFVDACEALLQDGAVMGQMYEEQRFDKSLFPRKSEQALSFYTVDEGEMVGVFKRGLSSVSRDDGSTWENVTPNPTIRTGMGKVWGQRTSDARFALLYNPTPDSQHRWPIAIATGEDGHVFDRLRAVTGPMSPQRYGGLDKNLGPQYMRGICERNPQTPDGDIWLAYSNNKEDIWISRVPVPVPEGQTEAVCECFAGNTALPRRWNIHSPRWSSVRMDGGALTLRDADPCDRAMVERALPVAARARVSVELRVVVREGCAACVSLQDDAGRTPVQIAFCEDGMLHVRAGGRAEPCWLYEKGKDYALVVEYDCDASAFRLQFDGHEGQFAFSASALEITRAAFSTKADWQIPYNSLYDNGKYGKKEQVLHGCEERICETSMAILRFQAQCETAGGGIPTPGRGANA